MSDSSPAFDALLAHASFVRRVARAIVGDEHAAEDVAQETWRAALEHPPREALGSGPWLGTLARNFARRMQRERARRRSREQASARSEVVPDAASEIARAEDLRRVVEATLALPEPYRATILMRFYEGPPPRRIAERTGVPVETVHTRLARGLARLRQMLSSRGDGRTHSFAALAWLAAPSSSSSTLGPSGWISFALIMKSKIALAVVLLAALVLTWKGLDSSAPRTMEPPIGGAQVGSSSARVEDRSLETSPAGVRQPIEHARESGAPIEGRVLDESGAPVADAIVHVLADEDPFLPADPAPQMGWNAYHGRTFTSASDGRFRAVLPEPARVFVVLGIEPFYEAVDERAREVWVDAPATGLEFRVRRVPTATVVVRARRAGSREALRDFQVQLKGEDVGYHSFRAQGEAATFVLSARDPDGVAIEVRLLNPECDPPPEAKLLVKPGEVREHLFLLDAGTRIAGHVVDESGVAIEGAIVYFGDAVTARGDEPFRAFQAERLSGAATSGADGFFELDGVGEHVTAWHAEHSPATVDRTAASRIVLGRRGVIEGRVLDVAGGPLADVPLQLDDREDGPLGRTDAEGRFRFAALEAGAHGIWRGNDLLAGVRLPAGESVELEIRIRPPGSLELHLQRGGVPVVLEELDGGILGLDPVFEFHEIEWERAVDPRLSTEGPVRPGRYLLLSRQGAIASFDVAESESAVVELGSAPLRVRAPAGTRLQVVPAESDAFTRLLAGRVVCRIGAEGELVFLLPAGKHVIVGEAGRELATVDLPEEGASLTLP